jgi:glycosyltransferase involved in cell wall biosynthesis
VNKKNSGHGRSCREGYELALGEGAAWILQIDSDGQCDPAFFPAFYKECSSHDCIFGQRETRDDGFDRVVISRCCSLLLWLMTGMKLKDPNVPYRLMRAEALKMALRKVPANFELQNIGLAFALRREPHSSWKYLPIHFRARPAGKSSYNYPRIVKTGMNLLRNIRRITHEDSHPRWARRRLAS